MPEFGAGKNLFRYNYYIMRLARLNAERITARCPAVLKIGEPSRPNKEWKQIGACVRIAAV